jgi:preprotein translocase subunit SecE
LAAAFAMTSQHTSNEGKKEVTETKVKRTSPITFFRQVVAELRKVVWPTRPQVANYFVVVLVFVLIMMALVAGIDFGYAKLMFWVFG